jgi:glucans biosynthesis protein C
MDETRPGKAGLEREPRAARVSPPKARGGGPAEMGNAFDVLRVAAALLVVMYHASLAYLASPLRLTLWFYDDHRSLSMDTFAYCVNGFAMPLFFLAAGVSAPAAVESRGVRVFLTHRVKRLLRPLLFGTLVFVPFCYMALAYGLLVTGRIDLENILSWRFSPEVSRHLYGLGHLWFLEYLFLVCVLWAACWQLARVMERRGSLAERKNRLLLGVLESSSRPFWLALPTALIFLTDSDTMLRVENNVVPNLARMIHYTYFFAVGAWLARVREPKARLIPHSKLYLAMAVVDFVVMWPLMLRHFASPLAGWERLAFVGLAALFPWLVVLGSLGVLMRWVHSKGAVLRYLAESSFWVYIVHVPVVQLVQALLMPVACPGPVKFLIVAASGIGFSLWTYEYVVRYSLLGEIINGARKRGPKRGWPRPELGWVVSLGAVVLIYAGVVGYFHTLLWGDNLYETAPGQLYRSARLSPKALDRLITSRGIRTVVTFGGGEHHTWFQQQRQLCQARGVNHVAVNLRGDRLPTREVVNQLIEIHDRAPRPTLVQGYRGIDQSGFAAAVTLLLDGATPERALRQFERRYGQFGGPERSVLGLVLSDYLCWLRSGSWSHSPERFREWAGAEYLVRSSPEVPEMIRLRVGSIASSTSELPTRR